MVCADNMETRVSITKNQADALRADITEINQMIQMTQMKSASNKRLVDMIVRDAEQDPVLFARYEIEEKNGQFYLIAKSDERSTLINGSPVQEESVTKQ